MFPSFPGNTYIDKKHLNLFFDCVKLSYVQND